MLSIRRFPVRRIDAGLLAGGSIADWRRNAAEAQQLGRLVGLVPGLDQVRGVPKLVGRHL